MDEQDRELERQAQQGDKVARERVMTAMFRRQSGFVLLWNVPPVEAPPAVGETTVGLSVGPKQEGRSWPMLGLPITCMNDLAHALAAAGTSRGAMLVDLETGSGFVIQARRYMANVEPRPATHSLPTLGPQELPYELEHVLNVQGGRGMREAPGYMTADVAAAVAAAGYANANRHGLGSYASNQEIEDSLEGMFPEGLLDDIVRSLEGSRSSGLSEEDQMTGAFQALFSRVGSDPATAVFLARLGMMASENPGLSDRFGALLTRRRQTLEARRGAEDTIRSITQAASMASEIEPLASAPSLTGITVAKTVCRRCSGRKEVRDCSYDYGDPTWSTCPDCNGTGIASSPPPPVDPSCEKCQDDMLKQAHTCALGPRRTLRASLGDEDDEVRRDPIG